MTAAVAPRVLVAEDDAPLRSLLTDVMREEFGAVVASVPDGRAAVVSLAAGAYDLVVLDLWMAHEDGFAVLRWVASRPPEARVPVVACTAANGAEREEALRLGAAACVAKPFDLDELTAVLRPFLVAPVEEPAA